MDNQAKILYNQALQTLFNGKPYALEPNELTPLQAIKRGLLTVAGGFQNGKTMNDILIALGYLEVEPRYKLTGSGQRALHQLFKEHI